MCYKCEEDYRPGHVCAGKTLNTLQGTDEILEVFDENRLREDQGDKEEESSEDDAALNQPESGVSVLVLSGEKQPDTIKVQGEAKG